MAKISSNEFQKIKTDTVLSFESDIQEYVDRFKALCENAENGIPRLDEMETLMDELSEKTRKNYLTMSSRLVNTIDEGDVIESKKENTGRKE